MHTASFYDLMRKLIEIYSLHSFLFLLNGHVKYSCRAICSVDSALFHVVSKHYIKSEVTFMSNILWEESFPISPEQYQIHKISFSMTSIRAKINSV